MSKNFVIFGPPGAGKGTQAKLIANKLNLAHLSSGDLLRAEVSSGSALGLDIEKYQDAGTLVPDELLTALMRKAIGESKHYGVIIFDGYPRSVRQIGILDDLLRKEGLQLATVINLEICEDVAIKRIMLRSKTSNRTDDNAETIKNRFKVYTQETEPVLEHYQKRDKTLNVDGESTVNKISRNILKQIA